MLRCGGFMARGGRFASSPIRGRLLVLMHADYGETCDLGRDVFYSWRAHDELGRTLERVLAGDLVGSSEDFAQVAALIEPRLLRTGQGERSALAELIARAAFKAAPMAVGGEDTRLLLAHIDAAAGRSRPYGRPVVGQLRFNVPAVVVSFTGREQELAALHDALRGADRAVVTQAISGLGGVGKSQLAVRYVQTHADEYDIVAWIGAESGGIVGLAALAARLGEPVEGLSPSDRAQLALDWLGDSQLSWLLVLDNVESAEVLKSLIPRSGNGRVLVTSRDRSLRQFGPLLEVDVFDEETATRFLMERAGRPHDAIAARELVRALGCLPLALSHAAAYCQDGTSFANYRQLLEGLPARELFDSNPEVSYAQTVATTWKTSIVDMCDAAPLAADVLELAAHLAPDAIPKSLFSGLIDATATREHKRLTDAFNALARFSLAIVDDEKIGVHRLLQKVVRDDIAARQDRAAALRALTAVHEAFPGEVELPGQWPPCEQLLPHVLALADTLAQCGDTGWQLIELLNRACSYLNSAERGQRAVAAAKRTLAYAQRTVGPGHPITLRTRHNLAIAIRNVARNGEGLAILEPLLADSQRILGTEHPSTLAISRSIAAAHWDVGSTDKALAILEPLATNSERILGTEHPDTLDALDDLGSAYWVARRPDDAVAILEPLLIKRERLHGHHHPSTLATRNNLAVAYRVAGRTDDAVTLLEALIADSERVLGADHSRTFVSRHNLAEEHKAVGRIDEAITILEPLVADRERILGTEHRDTLITRTGLASAYRSAGRTHEALAILEPLLSDYARILGAKHPDTLHARRVHATIYQDLARIAEAIAILEPLLADYEQLRGADHPETVNVRDKLATAYRAANRSRFT
jgi:tetratricopeptide (TPR) repeat protein